MPQNEDVPQRLANRPGAGLAAGPPNLACTTLGILTLTGYNSEYSDKSFLEKRNMEGGFGESPLKVNVGLWEDRGLE